MAIYRTEPVQPPAVVVQSIAPSASAQAGGAVSLPALPTTGVAPRTVDRPRLAVILASVAALAAVLLLSLLFKDDAYVSTTPRPVTEGLTIFAVFFVVAQGIERLLEPFAMYFVPDAKKEFENKEKAVEQKKTEAAQEQQKALTSGSVVTLQQKADLLQTALNEAATKKVDVEQWAYDRKVIFWAIASAVAILASASMKIYLLRTVGISSAPRWLEILSTGLIIGAGTKPLHDLVTLISAKAADVKST